MFGRPPLWLVSPLHPERSGLSLYTERLASALSAHARVRVYTTTPHPRRPRGARVRSLRRLRRGGPLLFCLGNNPRHVEAWGALARLGGDALLHDATQHWLYEALAAEGRVSEALASDVPEEPRNPLAGQEVMVRDLLGRAGRVFVHTHYGRGLLAQVAPDIHVEVVPFGFPPLDPGPARRDPPLIASFGGLKGGLVLADALPAIVRRVPEVRLRFIGRFDEPTRVEMYRRCAVTGVGDRLEMTGWVDEDHYRHHLHEATLSVQLRMASHGEMSGAVADCLSAGLPTVVSALGGFAELPDTAVHHMEPGLPAAEAAEEISRLLLEPRRLEALRAGALAHAAEHSFQHAAAALWNRLSATPAPSARTRTGSLVAPGDPT